MFSLAEPESIQFLVHREIIGAFSIDLSKIKIFENNMGEKVAWEEYIHEQ